VNERSEQARRLSVVQFMQDIESVSSGACLQEDDTRVCRFLNNVRGGRLDGRCMCQQAGADCVCA
jgi:hypothetical protein